MRDADTYPASHDEMGQDGITRRRLLAGALAGSAALALPAGLAEAAQLAPKRGGRLRVGIVGGGAKELLDPQNALNEMDIARTRVLFESLTDYAPNGLIVDKLAAGFAPNKTATVWKIKVRPGVRWHDGSLLTADDVVYSLRRIVDPKNKLQGAGDLPFLKPAGIRRIDSSTVELRLESPVADVRTPLASRAITIIKNGTTNFAKPIGTGAFSFVSFARGQRTRLEAFEGYRKHRGPYLAELELISINDPTSRLRALQAGQIDAMVNLDAKLVKTVMGSSALRVLQSKTGGFTCQTMQVTTAPFDDPKVREAIRLLVDRKQIVSNALLGYGTIGNDLACPFDEYYADAIPQRPYDPERAQSLLKSVGKEGLTVSLYTSDAAQAMLESSTLIAAQAKKAGVTVELDRVPAENFYTDKYLKAAFSCSQWSQKPLDTQILQSLDSKAPYNETAFKDPAFDKITREARRTLNAKKRKELYTEAQRMLHKEGGNIIWGFPNLIDAHSAKVKGLKASTARSLGYYDFVDVHLA